MICICIWFAVTVKVREHKRDAQLLPLVKQFLGYHLEMAYNEDPEQEIVLLLDLQGAGMSNLVCANDIDLSCIVISNVWSHCMERACR